MPSKYKQGSMKVYVEVITTIKFFYKFDHIHPPSRNIHLNKVTLFCSRKHFIQTADGASDGRPHPFLVTFDETFDWKTCLHVYTLLERLTIQIQSWKNLDRKISTKNMFFCRYI